RRRNGIKKPSRHCRKVGRKTHCDLTKNRVRSATARRVHDARTSNEPELRCASRELSNDPPAGFSEELGVKLADGSSRWLLSWVATYRDNEVVTVRCSVHPCDTSVGKPLH